MEELIIKKLTEVERLEKQVVELEDAVIRKDIELKQVKVKSGKKQSIGYFRARFKGG